jgi:diguanylate cyclase (GGDEF)-like protein/PAS domain S-box-containing protein
VAKEAGAGPREDHDRRRRHHELEIATREAAEAALREALERRRRQFDVVGIVAQSEALAAGDVDALVRQITELAVQAAGCERADVWLFNDDDTELRCIDLYEAATGTHSSGLVLSANEFGAEFATLITDRYVDADDASTDPRTAGYVDGYVKPLGITAMLDVLIGASGRHFGLLCLEHVGKPHHWEPDEIAFAGQLADKIAFAIGIHARRKAEERVRANEAALAAAQAIARVGSWEYEPATGRVTWSAETYRIFGVHPATFRPSYESLFARVHPDDRAALEAEYQDYAAQRRLCSIEHRIVRDDGEIRWVYERGEASYDARGRFVRSVGTVQDITERKRAEDAVRESEAKFRTVFGAVTEGILLSDPVAGTLVEVNESACAMFGYAHDEMIGMRIGDISSGASPHKQSDAMRLIEAAKAGPMTFDWRCRAKDGRMFWSDVSIRHTAFGERTLVLATLRDITERKKAEAQILQMARYDALTGLANRRVFAEAVQQAIARAQRGARGFAVLYLDLDHFKDVNDTLGHPIGDLLLKSVAERLKACVRETDTVARFGGDEFAVLAVDIADPTDAGILGDKILKALSRPYDIAGNEIRSGTSVGISVYGPDSPQAEMLLAHADVALYRAKSEGRGAYRFFTGSMDAEVRKRVTLDADLRTALDTNQLLLVYQPQVEAVSGRIVGVEALVRWRRPEGVIVPPDEFIGAAEKNGLIVPLGRWVLHEACRQAKVWREAGAPPVTVGVNLSALQFKTPLELEKDIAAALAENAMPPQMLELELTESVLMKAAREHNDVLLRLRKQGLRLAIDDFGTGFSSLDYLRRFPADRIKIAQVFIIDLVTAAGDAAIVKAAIGLARELGISVIAEGVETEAQLRLLQAWGCREVQGYYFSKPVDADAVLPLLRSGRIVPA